MKDLFSTNIKGLLIDISGVLKDGKKPIEGSCEAIKRLQDSNFPFRLVTNETQASVSGIVDQLQTLGFRIQEKDIFSPIPAVIKIINDEKLRPFLLVHPQVLSEFEGINKESPNCVVVGDADMSFTYENMNSAFKILMDLKNPILFSLGKGKYYKSENELTLDVGPFTTALEYATGVKCTIVGKPDPTFFLAAVKDIGINPDEAVMIGDDVSSDVGGAQNSGVRGVLVRTGKFRPEDEQHAVKPDGIFDNLNDIVNEIFLRQKLT